MQFDGPEFGQYAPQAGSLPVGLPGDADTRRDVANIRQRLLVGHLTFVVQMGMRLSRQCDSLRWFDPQIFTDYDPFIY